jgi:hypothetical protein
MLIMITVRPAGSVTIGFLPVHPAIFPAAPAAAGYGADNKKPMAA